MEALKEGRGRMPAKTHLNLHEQKVICVCQICKGFLAELGEISHGLLNNLEGPCTVLWPQFRKYLYHYNWS